MGQSTPLYKFLVTRSVGVEKSALESKPGDVNSYPQWTYSVRWRTAVSTSERLKSAWKTWGDNCWCDQWNPWCAMTLYRATEIIDLPPRLSLGSNRIIILNFSLQLSQFQRTSQSRIITQVAQQSQRDRAAGWISFGQKWKTGTRRQHFADIIFRSIFNHCVVTGQQSYRIRWKNTQNKGSYAVQGHSR